MTPRFEELVDLSLVHSHESRKKQRQRPRLVSFVGETGVEKSTLSKLSPPLSTWADSRSRRHCANTLLLSSSVEGRRCKLGPRRTHFGRVRVIQADDGRGQSLPRCRILRQPITHVLRRLRGPHCWRTDFISVLIVMVQARHVLFG